MTSTALPRSVVFEALIRDLRHMEARAASDLVDWLVHLEARGMADRTIDSYHRSVAALLRAYPEKALDEFTDTNIEAVIARTPRQSRHITQSIFNQFFKWAYKKRRIRENPMDFLDAVRKLPRRPRELFTEAEMALLEGLPSPDGPLWMLLFGSGIRRGEARAAKRSHVDLEHARLIVQGKGDKGRIVPLPTEVLAAIADLDLYERLTRDDYLWYGTRGGGRYRYRGVQINNSSFDRWYRKGIDAAGVRYLSPHTTRHCYGHRLRGKYDLEERQLLMGHEDSRTTTKYYGHLTIEDVARKVAEVGL